MVNFPVETAIQRVASTKLSRILIVFCSTTWLLTAISPYKVEAWLLEQIATLICVGLLGWAAHTIQFSTTAKLSMAILFILHAIGTHYTYSLTPYNTVLQELFYFSLDRHMGWARNQ